MTFQCSQGLFVWDIGGTEVGPMRERERAVRGIWVNSEGDKGEGLSGV